MIKVRILLPVVIRGHADVRVGDVIKIEETDFQELAGRNPPAVVAVNPPAPVETGGPDLFDYPPAPKVTTAHWPDYAEFCGGHGRHWVWWRG